MCAPSLVFIGHVGQWRLPVNEPGIGAGGPGADCGGGDVQVESLNEKVFLFMLNMRQRTRHKLILR